MRPACLARTAVAMLLAAQMACGDGGAPEPATSPAPQGEESSPTPAGGSPAPTGTRCDVRLEPPPGFALVETHEEQQGNRIGVRLSYRGPDGRTLEFVSGIAGEWNEGAPSTESVTLATGEEAQLFGGDETWGLWWGIGMSSCEQRVVLGNGFDRSSFIELARSIGVLPRKG